MQIDDRVDALRRAQVDGPIQVEAQRTPAGNLGVDVAADALVGPQPIVQIEGDDYVVPPHSQTKRGQRSGTSPQRVSSCRGRLPFRLKRWLCTA